MSEVVNERRNPVLDPIERVSEVMFGLIMALTFTGSLSVASDGREEIRTMMLAALGCNLAWGLVDAVMYLVGTLTERARNLTLVRQVRDLAPQAAHAVIADALPGRLGEVIGPEGLEEMRRRLVAVSEVPARARLGWDDFVGAFGVFLIVVLATFPLVIPFMIFSEITLAMRVSNGVALAMLFVAGWALGRHSGVAPWRTGFTMIAVGAFLVGATMALGG